MESIESYDECLILSDELKEDLSKMSDFQISMIAELIASSLRSSEIKIREDFEKDKER